MLHLKTRRKLSGLHSIQDDISEDRVDSSGGYYDDVVKPQHEDLEDMSMDNSRPSLISLGEGDFLAGHFTKGWVPLGGSLHHQWSDKSLSYLEFFVIGSFWFGWSFVWMPLVVVIIPKQMTTIVEHENRGHAMGQAFVLGSIGSLFFSPLFGAMSDRSRNKMGRRRPFIILGCGVSTFGLFIMSFSPRLSIFCVGFFLLSFGNFIAMAPYSALVPDVVPANQRGKASGWLGAMSVLGFLAGGGLSYNLDAFGVFFTYSLMIAIFMGSAYITVRYVPEVRVALTAPYFSVCECICAFFEAFMDHDFFWVFSSRFFIQMGCIAVQENLQFYLLDSLGRDYSVLGVPLATDEAEASSVLFVPLLTGALLSSVFAGYLSDLWGGKRKQLIYISGGTMAAAVILFGINRIFFWDIIISLIFGFGFGIFSAIDWALATDVLPNSDTHGKDMGLWNLAFTLPQVIIAPTTGATIDYFHKNGQSRLGWFIIFGVVSLSFLIGTFLVRKVHNVK